MLSVLGRQESGCCLCNPEKVLQLSLICFTVRPFLTSCRGKTPGSTQVSPACPHPTPSIKLYYRHSLCPGPPHHSQIRSNPSALGHLHTLGCSKLVIHTPPPTTNPSFSPKLNYSYSFPYVIHFGPFTHISFLKSVIAHSPSSSGDNPAHIFLSSASEGCCPWP